MPSLNINDLIARLGIDTNTLEGLEQVRELAGQLQGGPWDNTQQSIEYLNSIANQKAPGLEQDARVAQQDEVIQQLLGQALGQVGGLGQITPEQQAQIGAQQDAYRGLAGGQVQDAYSQQLAGLARRGITGGTAEFDLGQRTGESFGNIEHQAALMGEQLRAQRVQEGLQGFSGLAGLLGGQQGYGTGQQQLGFNYDQLLQQSQQFQQQMAMQQQQMNQNNDGGWLDLLGSAAGGVMGVPGVEEVVSKKVKNWWG